MYIACIFLYNTQKKTKKLWLASFGKFISYGTELNPNLPFSEQVWEKGGGGNFGRLPGNRLVLAYFDRWGHLALGLLGLLNLVFVYEFNWVSCNLPAYQVVVIQQLSIG